MSNRRNYSISFKSRVALEAIRGDLTLSQLSSKYGVNPNLISKWKKQAIVSISHGFSDKRNPRHHVANNASQIKDLHAKIGQLTVERDFLSKAFES